MLEQVVINLCVNARDAMPQGGRLTLHTEAVEVSDGATAANAEARAGRFVRLSVTDTGCGMDEPTLQRIFEPFFTTKGAGKGTGLGLATVHGIVKQHCGWIEVQSTPGRGTTFGVYLPVCAMTAQPATPAEAAQPTEGRNELLLVVEDETAVRTVLAAILRCHGYRVIAAANGPEALRLWEKHRDEIALLFTDMVMPEGMNGRTLAERLRLDQPDLKVMIHSGYSRTMTAQPPDASRRMTILDKPADAFALLRAVRQCLDHTEASAATLPAQPGPLALPGQSPALHCINETEPAAMIR
jgi:CheY-like chemotaxis protein